MSAIRRDASPCNRVRWREVVLGMGLVAVMAVAAEASPIRGRASGDSPWISRPLSPRLVGQVLRLGEARIATALRLRAVHGLLPEGPIVDYLQWRRALKPARFGPL